jgi:hypothetical protein
VSAWGSEHATAPETAARLAQRTSTSGAYLESDLRSFPRRFYAEKYDPPERSAQTDRAASHERLPPYAGHVLAHPDDLLLKPIGIQLVTPGPVSTPGCLTGGRRRRSALSVSGAR